MPCVFVMSSVLEFTFATQLKTILVDVWPGEVCLTSYVICLAVARPVNHRHHCHRHHHHHFVLKPIIVKNVSSFFDIETRERFKKL